MKQLLSLILLASISLGLFAQETVKDSTRVFKTSTGIIVMGDSCNVRAFGPFGGGSNSLEDFAALANEYYKAFEGNVNVYCMPIPTAAQIYGRKVAPHLTRPEDVPIANCFQALNSNVKGVELITTLNAHAHEAIYSRTDHHWAPLGAFYAAQQFAKVAGVPFRDLTSYDKHVVKDFVGTMYRFSKCIDIKNNPEDFVYYIPRDVEYTTTYTDYSLDKARRNVVKVSEPHEGEFFWTYKDGSGLAYCTFMGGDSKLTHVKTSTKNGRKLLITKDSFGNAIPGFLFYSFEEIHVVDCRYYKANLTQYVKDNGVTDILISNNMAHAATARTIKTLRNYLVQ